MLSLYLMLFAAVLASLWTHWVDLCIEGGVREGFFLKSNLPEGSVLGNKMVMNPN